MLKSRAVRIGVRILIVLAVVAIPLGIIGIGAHYVMALNRQQTTRQSATKTSKAHKVVKKAAKPTAVKVNWHQPSEKQPYPDVKKHPNIMVDVSTKKQRVYLKDGSKVLYTMLASTGSGGDNATPKGTYRIQPERGEHFYNANSGEGANYWVSWKDHGIYLFHSVPVDQSDHYVVKQAEQLGKKANSHGCVRLTIADAKWMYHNIPVGAKVVIE